MLSRPPPVECKPHEGSNCVTECTVPSTGLQHGKNYEANDMLL